MTKDEIFNLAIGTEMNSMIAQDVMGWKAEDKWWTCNGVYMAQRLWDSEYLADPFDPSGDMNDAWKVVEYFLFQNNIGLYLSFKNALAELLGNQLHPSWTMSKKICQAAMIAIK